ncbi:MAG: hypothetical protein EOP09_14340, partial [Proteobacteria bacterium]
MAIVQSQVSSLSNTDLKKLLNRIGKERNAIENQDLFELAITEYAKRDPDSAMSWFIPENMNRGEPGFYGVCRELAVSRPEILKNWLLSDLDRVNEDLQGECLAKAIDSLAKVDAKSAYVFAMDNKWKRYATNDIILGVFPEFARQDAAEAEKTAMATLKGFDLVVAQMTIAMTVGETDPDAGIKYASKIADPVERGISMAAIVGGLFETKPDLAITKLQGLGTADMQMVLQSNAGTFLSLAKILGAKHPDTLFRLVDEMVPSSANEAVFKDAIDSLGNKYPEKAMQLISSLPESDLKTQLTGIQFKSLAMANPEEAIQAASKIGDPRVRGEAYKSIGSEVGATGWENTFKTLKTLDQGDRIAFMDAAIFHLSSG